ncbi:hypothetical protein BJV82DRAFT_664938 [Fennellomyces sp. T-0311]|nr:hypothetical protein BJV82DRAFT_664938 [Fennellomyces sp. T-0311]
MTKKPNGKTAGESSSIADLSLAVLRMEQNMKESLKRMNKKIANLTNLLSKQNTINTRLANLLEQQAYDRSQESVERIDSTVALISHPTHPYFDKKKQKVTDRPQQHSLPLLRWLSRKYRSDNNLPALTDEQTDARLKHVRKIAEGVILYFKHKYALNDTATWKSVRLYQKPMIRRLEHEQNVQQGTKRNREGNTQPSNRATDIADEATRPNLTEEEFQRELALLENYNFDALSGKERDQGVDSTDSEEDNEDESYNEDDSIAHTSDNGAGNESTSDEDDSDSDGTTSGEDDSDLVVSDEEDSSEPDEPPLKKTYLHKRKPEQMKPVILEAQERRQQHQ